MCVGRQTYQNTGEGAPSGAGRQRAANNNGLRATIVPRNGQTW